METPMYEILEGLRKLLDFKDKNSTSNANKVEIIDGAIGGAIPKVHHFSCEQCKFSATNMNIMNKHVRQEHLSTTFPCITCDFQAKTMSDLRNHQKKHSSPVSYTCTNVIFARHISLNLI